MAPAVRKAVLIAHVTASVGWTGAVLMFLALAVLGLTAPEDTARALYVVMAAVGWGVLVPFAVASLVTGIVQALGTSWGLFRYYWVVAKLVLSVLTTTVLIVYMGTLESLAQAATSGELLRSGSPVLHASGAVVVLVTATALSVLKPRGLTPHGWRQQQRASATPGA